MINSLLIVCVGNICRSPAVEKLFKKYLSPSVHVTSAGLGALVGKGIENNMKACLIDNGINDIGHSAQQFTPSLGRSADLILVMEDDHLKAIAQIAPEVSGKTMLLGKWNMDEQIEDPYRKSQEFFFVVYEKMNKNVESWIKRLN